MRPRTRLVAALAVCAASVAMVGPTLFAQTFHDPASINAGARAVVNPTVQQRAAERARSSERTRQAERQAPRNTAANGDIVSRFGERPYAGQMILEVNTPGERPITKYGEGTARLVRTGDGRADLHLEGQVPGEQTNIRMVVEGRYDQNGWTSGPGATRIRLAPDGRIEGQGREPAGEIRMEGHATDTTFSLTSEVRHATASQGVPAGSVSRVRYMLQRETSGDGSRGSGNCRMETRPIANTAGGGMTMAQVPVCD